jgi:hypothetical protein
MDKHLAQIWEAITTFAIGLSPAALGALVAVSYEKGLTWADRFTQFAVGVVVSYFTTRVVGAVVTLDPFVLQGVSFSIGMIAFKAAPRFISGAAEVLGSLPGEIRDRILPAKRKDGK